MVPSVRRLNFWLVAVVALVVVQLATAAGLEAQRVSLRIRPSVGDTLRMRLEQRFEMGAAGAEASMSGSMMVWTHAIVLDRVGASTDLLSVTDSVDVTPPSAATLAPLRAAKRALEGRTVQLRMNEDGALTVRGPERQYAPGAGLGADMPAVLPQMPVAAGDTWTQQMRVPLSATQNATALVRTTFRLDSLSQDNETAYLSLRADVSHDHAEDATEARGQTTGTLSGTMQLDRRLNWITESRMTVSLNSVVSQGGRPPVHVRMRVTQFLKALPGG